MRSLNKSKIHGNHCSPNGMFLACKIGNVICAVISFLPSSHFAASVVYFSTQIISKETSPGHEGIMLVVNEVRAYCRQITYGSKAN